MSFRDYKEKIDEGDTVILYVSNNFHAIDVLPQIKNKKGDLIENVYQTNYGALKVRSLIGAEYGSRVELSKGWGHVLQPTPELWSLTLPHRTQIIYTPDISMIMLQLDLVPGSVIIEAGTGSGSLTHALIRRVRPSGHVFTFDFHEHRAKVATEEFQSHGLADFVTAQHRDVCQLGFGEELNGKADAVFLDLPGPWTAIGHAVAALKEQGGRFCSFSPCIEQVQRTCLVLQDHGFEELATMEVLQTELRVSRRIVPVRDLSFLKQKTKRYSKMTYQENWLKMSRHVLFDKFRPKRFSSFPLGILQAPYKRYLENKRNQRTALSKKVKKPKKSVRESKKSRKKIRNRRHAKNSLITISLQSSDCEQVQNKRRKSRRLRSSKRSHPRKKRIPTKVVVHHRKFKRSRQKRKLSPVKMVIHHHYPARKPVKRKIRGRKSKKESVNVFASKMQNIEVENSLLKNKLNFVTKEMKHIAKCWRNQDLTERPDSRQVAETTWAWVDNARATRVPSVAISGNTPSRLSNKSYPTYNMYLPGQRVRLRNTHETSIIYMKFQSSQRGYSLVIPEVRPAMLKMNMIRNTYDSVNKFKDVDSERNYHDTEYIQLRKDLQVLQEENKMFRNMSLINKKESSTKTMLEIVNERQEAEYEWEEDDAKQKLIDALRDAKTELQNRVRDIKQLKDEQYTKTCSLENDLRQAQAANDSLHASLEAAKDGCKTIEDEFEDYKLKMAVILSAKDNEIEILRQEAVPEEGANKILEERDALELNCSDTNRTTRDLEKNCENMKAIIKNLELRSSKAVKLFSVLRNALKLERSAKLKFEAECAELSEKLKLMEMEHDRKRLCRKDSEFFGKKVWK